MREFGSSGLAFPLKEAIMYNTPRTALASVRGHG